MDNQRLILFFGLMFVILLVWEAWDEDYGPKDNLPVATVTTESGDVVPQDVPAMAADSVPATAAMTGSDDAPTVSVVEPLAKGERIVVNTGMLTVEIDTKGGDVRSVDLHDYPVSIEERDKPFQLMKDRIPNLFVAQSGLISKASAPDHHALYSAEKPEYSLAAGDNELRIPMTWDAGDGIQVIKTYIFTRDSHVINVEHKIVNNSAEEWNGRQYRQLQRSRSDGSGQSMFIYTYTGGVIYSEEEKYEKYDFDDMQEAALSRDITDGWAAIIQHYFLAAIIPAPGEANHYYSKAPGDDRYILGLVSPSKSVAAGHSEVFNTQFYVGPKEQAVLKELAPGLELTVDYGILTIIAKPLFWTMGAIHGVVGNWGWAILGVTLLIKLIFYPLSAASYRSMANMRRMTPKMQQIKERYGDDRQRMSQAMMDLYKKEKINPLGGCLPMLVQIPVFIALYWVLLESVELRQAPFIFWIEDMAVRDPYYVLPLLMGISMFFQQKLNPTPPDPVQAKIMMALPVVFTLFFAFFPSGLVLYWVANSVLSIAQQWWITHRIDKAAEAAKS